MQTWLRQHPTLGTTLTEFVDHGVICRKGKYFAIGGFGVTFGLSLWWLQPSTLWLSSLLCGGAALVVFLGSRPEQVPVIQTEQGRRIAPCPIKPQQR